MVSLRARDAAREGLSMATLLEVSNLTKSFGTVTAASDLNVTAAAGEVIGIVGANGAGKTVFVNMITGYEKPSTGAIRFEGRDITGLPPRKITELGICRSFQVSQVFQTLSAFDNLLLALSINRTRGVALLRDIKQPGLLSEADDLLERFGLQAYRARPARELAQGVRKLLDIAMAFAARPRVLLLDEPTSGISSEEKVDFMRIVMGALARENATVFIIEHDMDIIERFVSRVLAFSQGRIICDATPQEALRDPEVVRYVLGVEHARTREG
jgi:branched-chain amino acid transport system ATP-binding protein